MRTFSFKDPHNDIRVVSSIVQIVLVSLRCSKRDFFELECLALGDDLVHYLNRKINMHMVYGELRFAKIQAPRKGHDNCLHQSQ